MLEAQAWLDRKYSDQKKRKEIINLEISDEKIKGKIKFANFTNLRFLNLSENSIIKLDLTDCWSLEIVVAQFNLLISIDLPVKNKIKIFSFSANFLTALPNNLNPDTLETLDLRDNLLRSDLSIFTTFTNLKELYIGENAFFGSLEFLRSLVKLSEIDISATDISHGLEFLPASLNKFYCTHTVFIASLIHYQNSDYSFFNTNLKLSFYNGSYHFFDWKMDYFANKVKKPNFQICREIVPYVKKDWRMIDPACTAELQREWENNGFDYQTAREWIKVGLRITDSYYAEWLKKIGLSISEFIDNPFSDLITFFKFVYKGESRRNLATSPIFDGQTWLNNEYLQRKSIVDLIIDRKNLNNSLIIEDLLSLERISAKGNHLNEFVAVNLPKLQKISLTWNPLRNFAIYNCSVLTELDLSSNDLTELNWLSNLNSEILISLNLSDNKFPLQDLSAFSCFTNLEKLCLSSNNFAGSLKHLRFLTRLKNLNISYTKIDCGLEYLSDKIIMIICVRTPFEKQLLLYKNNLQEWQKNRNKKGKFLIKEEDLFSDKRIKELENKLREEKLKNAILQEGFIKLKNFVDELSVSAYNLQEMKLYDNV